MGVSRASAAAAAACAWGSRASSRQSPVWCTAWCMPMNQLSRAHVPEPACRLSRLAGAAALAGGSGQAGRHWQRSSLGRRRQNSVGTRACTPAVEFSRMADLPQWHPTAGADHRGSLGRQQCLAVLFLFRSALLSFHSAAALAFPSFACNRMGSLWVWCKRSGVTDASATTGLPGAAAAHCGAAALGHSGSQLCCCCC